MQPAWGVQHDAHKAHEVPSKASRLGFAELKKRLASRLCLHAVRFQRNGAVQVGNNVFERS
jgi:hypothetical protein